MRDTQKHYIQECVDHIQAQIMEMRSGKGREKKCQKGEYGSREPKV